MPPRKAAAKNSRMRRANASDQEGNAKKPINKRSSKVEVENMVEELPPKKKAKVHNQRKQSEWTGPVRSQHRGRYTACSRSVPIDCTRCGGLHAGSNGA